MDVLARKIGASDLHILYIVSQLSELLRQISHSQHKPLRLACHQQSSISTRASIPTTTTSSQKNGNSLLTNDDNQQHHADNAHDDHHLHVGPPLLPLELTSALLKLARPVLQCVRPAVQLRQLLVPLQHLLHVDAHDADHLVDLGLRLLQLVVGGGGILPVGLTSGRLDATGTRRGWNFRETGVSFCGVFFCRCVV